MKHPCSRRFIQSLATTSLLLLALLAFTSAQDPAPAPADNAAEKTDNAATADDDDGATIPAFGAVVSQMVVRDMPLGVWLMDVASEHHFNLLLAAGLPTGNLNLTLRDVPLGVAIAAACASQDCRITIAHHIVFVWPHRTGADMPDLDCVVIPIAAAAGPIDQVTTQVRALLSAHGLAVSHDTSRVMFVVDTADARATVARYIDAIANRTDDGADDGY